MPVNKTLLILQSQNKHSKQFLKTLIAHWKTKTNLNTSVKTTGFDFQIKKQKYLAKTLQTDINFTM